MTAETPGVLFVCVHTAGRSQMAALLSAHLGGGVVRVRSAGSDPADRVNPLVVEAMAELVLGMSAKAPKLLTDDAVRGADAVVTMGCGDACPLYPASATRTGSSRTPRRRTRSARSATRSGNASRCCSARSA